MTTPLKLKDLHILVAHPDAFAASRLRALLEAEGALVAIANTGALSLGLSAEHPVDLLVAFAGLTDMPVSALISKVRERSGREVPCLVVSAFLREDQVLDVIRLPRVMVKDRGTTPPHRAGSEGGGTASARRSLRR